MERKRLSELHPLPAAVSVGADESIEGLVQAALDHPEAHDICVVDGRGRLVGVVNIKTLFRTVFCHHTDPHLMVRDLIRLASSEVAGDIMVTDPVVALETETLGEAVGKMVAHELGELPVVDEGKRVVGSLSIRDVFREWVDIEIRRRQ
ncbi:MAG: CBS domain-containing protein [Deltaproteobacteria bacterium]|nr:CBS domain-containing protein [Deltaproteobacteria bacterium]